ENNQKIYKKDNFYIISIEIVFFSLIQELYVPDSFIYIKKQNDFLVILKAWSVTPFSSIIPQISLYHQ
ncbi:MAG: hypothetical protein E6X68_10695, partial [Staphylococcus haemolyticus]|nr:hypothetical protein [Staphylococcus haemolyticus]MDU6278376.1 hypothetical protein [Staphylococcus haemolyticus]